VKREGPATGLAELSAGPESLVRTTRYLVTPPLAGPANMEIDLALLDLAAAGGGPYVRVYAWEGYWLSLGYFQKPEQAVDVLAAAKAGVGIVRRPTGGKALLHGDEVTYSVALPPHHPLAQTSVLESYRSLSRQLVAALTDVGLPVELSPGTGGLMTRAVAPCATEVGPESITLNRRKLVGSAQVRRHGAVLQHGSIPLSDRPDDIVRLLKPPAQLGGEDFVDWYNRRTTSVAGAGFTATAGDIQQALLRRL
jgi:lipoate-protein ligase A